MGRKEPVKVSYHPAKAGCHSHYGNRDTMIFFCHVTLQDHEIKAFYDFMKRNLSK